MNLTEQERKTVDRISRLIRKKLKHLSKSKEPVANVTMPVTLLELIRYHKGLRGVPLNHLALLLEFYGCPQHIVAEWNLSISLMAMRGFKKK